MSIVFSGENVARETLPDVAKHLHEATPGPKKREPDSGSARKLASLTTEHSGFLHCVSPLPETCMMNFVSPLKRKILQRGLSERYT